MANETKIKNGSKILPSGWRLVEFGDVVTDVKDSEKDPRSIGIERYIGLEHLEPENLHIVDWGLLEEDDVSFTKRFREGQILFGKRRAYQRKVSVATFDGICSSDILTFESKPEHLLADLLPFIVQSEGFFDHALDTSSGSLSPRTRWSQLREYKFPLPPIDEQQRMSKLLWSVDSTIQRWKAVSASLRALHERLLREVFSENIGNWPLKRLDEIASVGRGKFTHRPRNLPEFYGGEFPFVQTGDVHSADRILKDYEYYLTELGTTYSKLFPKGTILVTIAAVIGATAITEREVYVTDSVVGVVPSEDMDADFVELFLRSQRHYLEFQAATQTAQKNINLQVLRPLKVACPQKDIQQQIAARLLNPLYAAREVESHIAETTSLLKSLQENWFSVDYLSGGGA